MTIRLCGESDRPALLRIINQAAEAYRGVIPADRWHEPYMPEEELASEIASGVEFVGCEREGELVGVMGIQPVRNVRLIRHAYVLPAWQGHGIGSALIEHLCQDVSQPILVGTWSAADWAIGFYRRHGFTTAPQEDIPALLRTYWSVPDRQIETSTVLALPPVDRKGVAELIAASGVR
jgi:N-acetylglutamate synthase-like GNAT family acetyltransferase